MQAYFLCRRGVTSAVIEPLVLVHFAFTSQAWIFSLHSSIYVNKNVRNDDGQSDGDEDDGG